MLTRRPYALTAVLVLSASAAFAMGSHPQVDEEAVNARILPVARVEMAGASAGAAAGSRTGEQMYNAACSACHGSGALGAPKFGNAADWAPRLGKGLDGLLKSAVGGIRSMPAKGGVADATDGELARAIVFMANKSGGSLKEPK